jgi:hypothetical protein
VNSFSAKVEICTNFLLGEDCPSKGHGWGSNPQVGVYQDFILVIPLHSVWPSTTFTERDAADHNIGGLPPHRSFSAA